MRRAVLLLPLVLPPALVGCTAPAAPEESVKPGINEPFLAPGLEVEEWLARFEVESREIYHERAAIAAAVGLEPGDAVADVGAGTGLFLEALARAVGPRGKVYAVDVAPAFVEHLAERARALGLAQVEARLCHEDSVELPARSIDVAFVCDTYHHFEYPRSTMASIHRALRPGGELVIVDFERVPGVSREWVLDHVRAGKKEVEAELADFGFERVEEIDLPGLEENYVLRYAKR